MVAAIIPPITTDPKRVDVKISNFENAFMKMSITACGILLYTDCRINFREFRLTPKNNS